MHPTPRRRSTLRHRVSLLRRIAAIHYNQPATAIWRVPEAEVVLDELDGTGTALDLGCGDGTLATVLFENTSGVRWVGLDIDPRDVIQAPESGMYQFLTAASASSIPFADDSFDLIFSNSALEHMADLPGVISEAARVLRPEGRFVFTVPLPSLHDNLLWPRLLRWVGLRKTADKYLRHLDKRIAHVNYLTPSGWSEIMADAGLDLRSGVSYLSCAEVGCWETLANMTGGLAYLLAGGRESPREIQRALGADRVASPWLGRIVFWILLPFLVVVSFGARGATEAKRFSCLCGEAVKAEGTRPPVRRAGSGIEGKSDGG